MRNSRCVRPPTCRGEVGAACPDSTLSTHEFLLAQSSWANPIPRWSWPTSAADAAARLLPPLLPPLLLLRASAGRAGFSVRQPGVNGTGTAASVAKEPGVVPDGCGSSNIADPSRNST